MQRTTVALGDRDISVFSTTEDVTAPLFFIPDEEGTGFQLAQLLTDVPCHLAMLGTGDWFHDLTPWPGENPFQPEQPFGGGAADYLLQLREAVTQVEGQMGLQPAWRGLVGYSLAGLFALWALYHSGLFLRVGAVSASLWYEGFVDFMQQKALKALPVRAYFSYGAKEAGTKLPGGESLEALTERAEGILRGRGSQTKLEVNPGNHFVETGPRLEKTIRWLAE